MKAFVAILISALLVLAGNFSQGQVAFSKVLATGKCPGCDCRKPACCVDRSAPDPAPQPAVPATTFTAKPLSSALPAHALVWELPIPAATQLPSVSIALPRSEALPLYEWNCAYLI